MQVFRSVSLSHAIIEGEEDAEPDYFHLNNPTILQAETDLVEMANDFRLEAISRCASMRLAFEQMANFRKVGDDAEIAKCLEEILRGAEIIHDVAGSYGLIFTNDITQSMRKITRNQSGLTDDFMRMLDGLLLLLEIVLREQLDRKSNDQGYCIDETILRLESLAD